MKHILRSQQFDRKALEDLFVSTDTLIEQHASDPASLRKIGEGKIMQAVFYEPSTRTRFSFCTAAIKLGMQTLQTENAAEFSSAIKGETLEDTIRVLCGYHPHAIVLRHKEAGTAERAASVVEKYDRNTSIINAGDGKGQHPTQALLDVYTIKRELGGIDGITVTIGGDLKNGRTGRSLVYLLTKFRNVKFVFISQPNLKMEADIVSHLHEHNVSYTETEDLHKALSCADVAYWTRIQTEREAVAINLDLTIDASAMRCMKEKSVLLHPLPRVGEIAREVDEDRRAAYFRQAEYGMFVRMALLQKICTRPS